MPRGLQTADALTVGLLRNLLIPGELPLHVTLPHVVDDGSDLLYDVEGGPVLWVLEPLRDVVD
jgi:hypothetical protein